MDHDEDSPLCLEHTKHHNEKGSTLQWKFLLQAAKNNRGHQLLNLYSSELPGNLRIPDQHSAYFSYWSGFHPQMMHLTVQTYEDRIMATLKSNRRVMKFNRGDVVYVDYGSDILYFKQLASAEKKKREEEEARAERQRAPMGACDSDKEEEARGEESEDSEYQRFMYSSSAVLHPILHPVFQPRSQPALREKVKFLHGLLQNLLRLCVE